MAISIVVTLVDADVVSCLMIASGVPLGAAIGLIASKRVAMTAMPQMVALFNGCGGGAAAAVAVAEWLHSGASFGPGGSAAVGLGTLIGAISFSGSLVAFGKLQELLPTRPLLFPLQRFVNAAVLLLAVGLVVWLATGQAQASSLWLLLVTALVLGGAGTAPIGGGDMPVVRDAVNDTSRLATRLTRVVQDHRVQL